MSEQAYAVDERNDSSQVDNPRAVVPRAVLPRVTVRRGLVVEAPKPEKRQVTANHLLEFSGRVIVGIVGGAYIGSHAGTLGSLLGGAVGAIFMAWAKDKETKSSNP